VECRGAVLQSRSALVIRTVTRGMFRNRLKRGANDAYNHSPIHAPTMIQGHPNCVDLWSSSKIVSVMKPRIIDSPCANKATRPEVGLGLLHGTGNEVLAAGNCILPKDEQNPALAGDYKNAFESD
jgi:hypothetical protein